MKPLLYILLLTSHILLAQDVRWNQGSVVLTSGMVITGQISMTPGQNLILFKQRVNHQSGEWLGDERVSVDALPAHKLKAVFFYDQVANFNRRFVVVEERTMLPSVHLYEAVLQGRIDVLRRPRLSSPGATAAKDFDYFCSDHQKIVPIWKFYREIYSTFDDAERQQLAAFIKANNLQRTSEADVITIIGYYNKMARSGQPLARY